MKPKALALREGKAPVRDRLLTMLFLAALLHLLPSEVLCRLRLLVRPGTVLRSLAP